VYKITVRNSETGCTRTDEVTVTINQAPAAPTIANPNAVICAGATLPAFSATNVASGASVRWYADPTLRQPPLATGTTFVPPVDRTRPGTYTYFVTQAGAAPSQCQSPVTPVTLTISAAPVVNLGPDRNVCQGQTEVLNARPSNPSGGPVTYRWENGLTTPTINATRSGTYRVTVTQGTCSVTDEVTLTFVAPPQVTIPRRIVPLCARDPRATASLDAGPGANFTYEWRKLGANTVIGTTQKITVNTVSAVSDRYTVSIGNGGSCTLVDTIEVVNKCEPLIFVPDAFSPASTLAENQKLFVYGNYVGEVQMLIYNRWGELIHAQKGANLDELRTKAWDGNYLNKPVPTGSYVWKITYRSADFPEREPITLRGAVLLVR
jgi:gliding motility-associated-like protein